MLLSESIRFCNLDSRPHLHRFAAVRGRVVINKLLIFHVVRPDSESTSSCRFSVVVMSSIANHKVDIMAADELDRLLEVRGASSVDGERDKASERAYCFLWGENIAAVVCEEGGHDRADGVEVGFGEEPVRLQVFAFLRVVRSVLGSVTDACQRKVLDQLASDGLIEGVPVCCRRPAGIPGEAAACLSLVRLQCCGIATHSGACEYEAPDQRA